MRRKYSSSILLLKNKRSSYLPEPGINFINEIVEMFPGSHVSRHSCTLFPIQMDKHIRVILAMKGKQMEILKTMSSIFSWYY